MSPAEETIVLRTTAELLTKRADVVERRGGKSVEISPSLARRISEQLHELERLRAGYGDDR